MKEKLETIELSQKERKIEYIVKEGVKIKKMESIGYASEVSENFLKT